MPVEPILFLLRNTKSSSDKLGPILEIVHLQKLCTFYLQIHLPGEVQLESLEFL